MTAPVPWLRRWLSGSSRSEPERRHSASTKLQILFWGDYWDDMWRRKQQIAWGLSRLATVRHVVYVEQPLTLMSLLKTLVGRSGEARRRWRRLLQNRSLRFSVENVDVLTPITLLPHMRWSPMWNLERSLRDWILRHLLRRDLPQSDVIWVGYPLVPLRLFEEQEGKKIFWYDCTEDFTAWDAIPLPVREDIRAVDAYLTRHAAVVSAVSRILFDEKRKLNPRTYWLPNAVDDVLFCVDDPSSAVPDDMKALDHPILVFVGSLDESVNNWDLLERVARERPDWSIMLIGAISSATKIRQRARRYPSIHCLGQKPYQVIPAYLQNADVCIQFYKPIRKNDTGNSQKLYLYLASAKPIVSTRSADVENYQEWVSIADTPEEFVLCIEEAMASDTPELQRARRDIARANSWSVRLKEIEEILARDVGKSDG